MKKPPKNAPVLPVTTIFDNRVWQVAGGISKRPGAVYVGTIANERAFRLTKNGKSILYLVP